MCIKTIRRHKRKMDLKEYWKSAADWDEKKLRDSYLVFCGESKNKEESEKVLYKEWEKEIRSSLSKVKEEERAEFRAFMKLCMRQAVSLKEICLAVPIALSVGIFASMTVALLEELKHPCILATILFLAVVFAFLSVILHRKNVCEAAFYEDVIEIMDKSK